MEYKVISANRSPNRSNKNWRIFEKENLEKHFGPVLDVNGEDGVSVLKAFEKHKDTVEYIRWYPDPELLTEKEFKGMLYQNEKIGNIPYITNSAPGFKGMEDANPGIKVADLIKKLKITKQSLSRVLQELIKKEKSAIIRRLYFIIIKVIKKCIFKAKY